MTVPLSSTPTTSTQPKTKISDYLLGKKLGSGSFGTVWLASKKGILHQGRPRICAIKVLNKSRISSSSFSTLRREATTMRKLAGKPFVLQLLESFSNSKYAFMAIELADMGDLGSLMASVGVMTYSQMAKFLVQISTGLHSIHTANFVYRDLKPGNVLIKASGEVRLADFGLSKDLGGPNGSTRSFCGTALYVAPEIILRNSYNYNVDWYSLGIMVHQMYTGTIPYKLKANDTEDDLFQIIVDGKVDVATTIDRAGRRFIRWLTKKDPTKRPQNIFQLQKHPWVCQIPWNDIALGKIQPSFKMTKEEIIQARTIKVEADYSHIYEVPDDMVDPYGHLFDDF
ncbi:hypothetical protein CROQUDRAFT_42555 [Cronartium quercuum f. sp. fusiforme G11]|uniref:Protein kinase domain-containing protein n=1 Tax=Cronartium quercuum f. sp. fusiforme G11 TaxID=708437 RepID=A0A9P6NP39_9BASI|nr:hypothetical protein CROQUDRAFT_42555 [Cronartium quercuum f. sp. fusiforme G11]